MARKALIYWR